MSCTSYVHLQEDYILHATLCVMFSMRLYKQSTSLKDVLLVSSRKKERVLSRQVQVTPQCKVHLEQAGFAQLVLHFLDSVEP